MKSKHAWTKSIAFLFVLSLLTACGGGGGGSGPDGNGSDGTMTVTAVSQETGTTTITYNGNGIDPVFSAGFNYARTNIQMDSSAASVFISANGTTAGPYSITQTGSTTVEYTVYSSSTPTTTLYSALSGTVTLSNVGNIGQPITGSFEGYLVDVSNPLKTLNISGSFSATRQF